MRLVFTKAASYTIRLLPTKQLGGLSLGTSGSTFKSGGDNEKGGSGRVITFIKVAVCRSAGGFEQADCGDQQQARMV